MDGIANLGVAGQSAGRAATLISMKTAVNNL
jgi:hypothetical protein